MTERKQPHPHAAIIMEFARRAQEGDPYKGLQYRCNDSYWDDWDTRIAPTWSLDVEYRYKPQTININGYEVPEPLSAVPANGTIYYVVDFKEGPGACPCESACDSLDSFLVSRGIAHATREAAQKHAEALLSFTIHEGDERNYG